MRNFRSYIILVTFLGLIAFFFLNQIHPFVLDIEYNENKRKAEKPPLDLAKLDFYPKKYEQFLSDNFSLRGRFVVKMSRINSEFWKKSPKPEQVIIGENNFLFDADLELDCYYGKRNFDKKQLAVLAGEFEYRRKILEGMGIKMLLVFHPTKYSVYPEYLPPYIKVGNSISSGEQLFDYFSKNSTIDVLYSRDLLISLKKENLLYYRYDNHWNDLAGYYVSKEILRTISDTIPILPLSDFCTDTVLNKPGSLSYMTGHPDDYKETVINFSYCNNDAQLSKENVYAPPRGFPYKEDYQRSFVSSNENLPDAVIIRDSYAEALIPYLKNSFYRSTFIWDDWDYGFNLDIIQNENPDVVIYMILESLIPNILEEGLTDK